MEVKIMRSAIEILDAALQQAATLRPKAGGFPYLAETLRRAGITRNRWTLPACQSLYVGSNGAVVVPGTPLITGAAEVPRLDREALIRALRTDQAGESTFPEFLMASWLAGVVQFEVDFAERTVTYTGCYGDIYMETYPAVSIDDMQPA
jgi:uncharacterized protein YbcV (DUF1398 family)